MRNKIFLTIFLSLIVLVLLTGNSTAQNPKISVNQGLMSKSWSHKQFTNENDVLTFINSATSPQEFQIASIGGERGSIFHVFYQSSLMFVGQPKNWKLKKFNSAIAALDFINAPNLTPGTQAKDFKVCALRFITSPETIYLFYREINGFSGGWQLEHLTSVESANGLLNPTGSWYVADAQIATLGNKFFVFYRPVILKAPPVAGKPLPSWGWVKRETVNSAVDILNNGTSNVKKVMTTARIGAVQESPYVVFYIFYQ